MRLPWYMKSKRPSPVIEEQGNSISYVISIRKIYVYWLYIKLFFTYFIPRLFKLAFYRQPTLSNGKEIALYRKNDEGEWVKLSESTSIEITYEDEENKS